MRIPTRNTRGTLYRIVPYGIYDATTNQTLRVRIDHKYIVIDYKGYYILLTERELFSCDHRSTMIMCKRTKPWQNIEHHTCESSLYNRRYEVARNLCDYDIVEKLEDRITHIEDGVFHYAITEQEPVPVRCVTDNFNRDIKLIGNGFLTLNPACRQVF